MSEKRLYVVKDVPDYMEDNSSYCYVVKAETYKDAINIVRKETNCSYQLTAELADNSIVWE